MVGEDAAADAVDRAHRLPDLKVGLHVVLVEGRPLSPPEEIPDLVDTEGRFSGDMVTAGIKFFFLPKVRRQLAREIGAQFEAFARTGLPLDHVDTHKHFHLHPTVARLIIAIGGKYGARAMRLPFEPAGPIAAAGEADAVTGFGASALRLWTLQLGRAIRRAGLVSNDRFFGLAWSGAMTEARLLSLIPHLPDGVSEIYFHPAEATNTRLAQTMPCYRHEEELAALLSPRVRTALAAAGIVRTSFSTLAEAAP
jgi:chitin disaccharide deacetylase